MVRKKMKRAPESSEHSNVNLNNIVASWLKALHLPGLESVPPIPPDVDIFSLLHSEQVSSDQSAFTEARGLQALRAAVARGTASPEEVRFILLASLLLFVDPDTSALRKSVKGLLHAAENATPEALGSKTEEMVEIVAARFLEYFRRVMVSSTSPPPAALTQQRTRQEMALRMVVSLRWLAEAPVGKRALLKAQNGVIFIGCVAVLGEALNMQASVIKRWHGSGRGVSGRAIGAELVGEGEGGVAAADLSAALDACSEVLKTAASLMSLTK